MMILKPYMKKFTRDTYLFKDPYSEMLVGRISADNMYTVINESNGYVLLKEYNLWVNIKKPKDYVNVYKGKCVKIEDTDYVVLDVSDGKAYLSTNMVTVALVKDVSDIK